LEKGLRIKGLPVVSLSDGVEVGRVEDLIVDIKKGLLHGLTIDSGGVLKIGKYVELGDVVNIGKDAVTISDCQAIKDDVKGLIKKYSWLNRLGDVIYTADGTDIGTLQDVMVELPGGGVSAIEISGGIWADLDQGRKIISWESIVPEGGERLVVDSDLKNIWC